MGRTILTYPHPVLRKKAVPVDRVTPELLDFIAEMQAMMYDSNGVGLAAPQVGVSLRIITVDAGDGIQALINPQIIAREGRQEGAEGCLSFPNLHGAVNTRAERVTVRALTSRGKKVTLSGEGLWARAMQHEIDHLDGILFIDRVEPDSLTWVTGERDAEGQLIERPTTLEDALRILERQAELQRA